MKSQFKSNAWKKYSKGEDKDTKQLKDMFRQLARQHGCGCVEEEVFSVDLNDTNPLLPVGTFRSYPTDLYITRKNPPVRVIVEIDGGYHGDIAQQYKDKQRDEAITAKYGIPIIRFHKEDLLRGRYSEQELVELLGIQ